MLIGFSMIFVFSGPLLGPREMLLSRARGAYNRMPDHFLSLLLYVEHTKNFEIQMLIVFSMIFVFSGPLLGPRETLFPELQSLSRSLLFDLMVLIQTNAGK